MPISACGSAVESCRSIRRTEHIVDDPEAMEFFKREYRKPWVVEEVV